MGKPPTINDDSIENMTLGQTFGDATLMSHNRGHEYDNQPEESSEEEESPVMISTAKTKYEIMATQGMALKN